MASNSLQLLKSVTKLHDTLPTGRPDLVGAGDGEILERVGIDLVARCGFGGVRATIDRLDAHLAHQSSNMQATDVMALGIQKPLQHPAASEGIVQMQFVNPAHESQIDN